MCCRRQVCNFYTLCGHAYALPEEMIQCDNVHCKFSTRHPPSCTGPSCKKTCWQYRQPPQQYSPQIAELCPSCLRARSK
ncbi:hypothetical protein NM688_g3678 [Phlebia brevispora]|uniref:Uncharacterized protein n=1 Tax=Phlebia brevispora TaxID=194682 RepID=A0ACC1T5B6_9APHY|nr:hypothetical protein NM688_g3678 [Phlebia brevispora]